MESPNEIKKLLKENYLKVKELIQKKDPDDNPYKSQYEAKELLCEMKNLLKQTEEKEEEKDIRQNAMLAGVYYLLGTVFMATEEISSAEDHLLRCFHLVEDSSNHPDNILCAIACLNQIGLIYARAYKNEDALSNLHKSVEIYKSFTSNVNNEEPLTFLTMYADMPAKSDRSGFVILEKTHTLTLYYLAQVYTALELREKGAMYCIETLKRQIESNDFEPIEWAINCATMSQVLVERNAFKEARHHLAAATFVLNQYESELCSDESLQGSEELEAKKEELNHRRSDVLRCWVKYCIMLLAFSKDRLTAEDDEPSNCEPPPKELTGVSFPNISDSLNENVVTCEPLLTFEDARPVFLFGQTCCNEASKYYTLTEHASEYTCICMDHSQLYLGLAFFEEDEDRQCKMLKRRLDLLSSVIKHLNPTYYLDVCREMWMSLGQICSDMVALKLKKARLSGDPSAPQVAKINSLVEDGVNYYTSFIKSFLDRKTNQMPSDYPKEHEQSIVIANLYAARLYSKYIRPDKQKSVEIDKRSLEYYQSIVDYARTHKELAKEMSSEVKVADEMLLLLPYKITRLNEFAN